MKQEISRPWVSDYFAIALKYFFASKVTTQKELAARVGITPATMSDYTNMKRGKGASEDLRRMIAKILDWQYEDMISLGRLIHSGYDPLQWDRCYETSNTDPRYRVWVKRGGSGNEILLIPIPGYSEETGAPIKTLSRDEWEPEHNFTFVPLYQSTAEIDDAKAKPVGTRAFPKSWLKEKGVGEGSQCFAFLGMDGALPQDVSERDTILVHIPGGVVPLVEGKIYAIWEPESGRVLCRRLTKREGKLYVYNDQPNVYPPYLAENGQVRVLGPVIWIGRDIK